MNVCICGDDSNLERPDPLGGCPLAAVMDDE
jgi:hypothetical protein